MYAQLPSSPRNGRAAAPTDRDRLNGGVVEERERIEAIQRIQRKPGNPAEQLCIRIRAAVSVKIRIHVQPLRQEAGVLEMLALGQPADALVQHVVRAALATRCRARQLWATARQRTSARGTGRVTVAATAREAEHRRRATR